MSDAVSKPVRPDPRDVYDKTHTKSVKFKFNLKTDADILNKLKSVSNMQGYVKKLIRDDIAKENE